jgi:elongation factor Ts
MAEITADLVKVLRERTGAGMMDCKKALVENAGDLDKSVDYLRKKGMASAAKKAGRAANQGLVHAYIHGEGRIGVLLEVNCETDFVARTPKYKEFVNEIALQIAATAPTYLSPEEVPASVIAKEKEIAVAQMMNSGKPQAVLEKIAEGKIAKYYEENCLLNQAYFKEPEKTIADFVKETIASLGENISIRRFTRYVLGEGIEMTPEAQS